jgi:CRISPR/Cas system-associated exonuclease Cas4 (RecB family)
MIIEALAAARRNDRRDDEQLAHVADLYGCDLATWLRRNGYEKPPFDDGKLRKFDLGFAVEHRIISRLRDAGHDVATGMTVNFASIDAFFGADMIGHPDGIIDGETLVEIKTTDVRKPSPIVSPHYALQAAAYAIAAGLKRAIVHVTHVATYLKDEIEYEIDVEGLRERVMQRVREVLERTGPGTPMPDPEPAAESAAWICKYCEWSQCERSPAYAFDVEPF